VAAGTVATIQRENVGRALGSDPGLGTPRPYIRSCEIYINGTSFKQAED